MKKILIPALLVAAAAFTPGLRNAVEIPDRACEVAQTVAAPLFWHLWSELLDLELARWTSPVAYGGEVAWSDIFASGDLFDHYWNKLLRSYAIEALARPTLRETPSLDDAREFLRRLDGPERQESEPDVYRWREITAGHLAQIELDALKPKTITLHRLLLHRTN